MKMVYVGRTRPYLRGQVFLGRPVGLFVPRQLRLGRSYVGQPRRCLVGHLAIVCPHQIGLCFTLWRLLIQLEPALADGTHQPHHPACT